MSMSESRVRYAFLTGAEGAAGWLVSNLRLHEGVSTSYRAQVRLESPEGDDPGSLLGSACTLELTRDDQRRLLHGIVSTVSASRSVTGTTAVDIVVVPALEALRERTDSRIFQNKSVPEVLDLVLAPALAPYHRAHARRFRRSSYLQREYIVQYDESDLAFVERLMAEEGIWYFFEHDDARPPDAAELMVLVDSNEDALLADLGAAGDELPLQLDHEGKAHWQAVTHFQSTQRLGATSLTVRQYNWTNPAVVETRSVPADEPGQRAHYEPHGVHFAGYTKTSERFSKFDTDEQARLRWEYQQTRVERAEGRGNVVGLLPGQKVVVRGQATALNGEWIVLSVDAAGREAKSVEQDVEHLADYANTFSCARSEHPYRPARQKKPRVLGIQTGWVVGADGESRVEPGQDDIHTDEHGRIQVKLSWDRSTKSDPEPTTTCFLRVAQVWGGAGWGFMFTPRIGMEVLVSFLDGDPDRPLVTGCVYNGLNRPALALPSDKTKSYIKTSSSPSGKGGNELQFEDADGKQQVYLHAQRDHLEVVEHDQTSRIKANRVVDVGASRTERVGGDEIATILKTRTHTVHGTDTLRVVDGSERVVEVSGNHTTKIAKKRALEVGDFTKERYTGGRETTVKTSDRLYVVEGAHKQDHVSGQYNITADEHFRVQQGGDQLYIKDNFFVSTTGDVQLKNAGFHLFAKKGGKTTLTVDSELTIKVGRASITMQADGTVEVSGPTTAKLTAQGGSVEANAQGITATGTTTKLAGTTLTEITGALVKIN
jgi:type VI secretion system secreted protein VgrG